MNDAQLVRVLKALADENRFRMIQELAVRGELSFGRLVERFSLSQPTISHHLKILASAGLVNFRREAQRTLVTVDHELLAEVAKLLPARLKTEAARAASRRSAARRRAASE